MKTLTCRCLKPGFRLFELCLLLIAVFGIVRIAQATTSNSPVLLTQPDSTRAIALESVTMKPEPFPLTSSIPISSDTRTRIAVFAINVQLLPGEGPSAITSDLQDASGRRYPLTVEYTGAVPGFENITMLIVRLSDDLGNVGDVLLQINLHGLSSNRVRVGIGHLGGGPPDDSNQPPQVSISSSVISGVAPLTVGFSTSASDPDGYIGSYSWEFGDGQASSEASPVHVFQTSGTYSVLLTVTDNNGATASASVNITVSSPPSSGTRFKVLHWNVSYGRGTDNVLDLNRQATWMASMNVDLISLNEVPPADAQLYANLLMQKTGITWYSHWVAIQPGDAVGQQILSKYPLMGDGSLYLSFGRSVAQVTVSIGGKAVNFFSTHLSYESTSWRITQIAEMTNWMARFAEPRIVAGDFNLSPNWPEYSNMTAANYDSWAEAALAGTAVTYPDNPEGRTRKGRVDYINHSRSAPTLRLVETRMPDQRDLNNHNVVIPVGNSNDWGVRPSDHNFFVSTFDVW